MKRNLLSMSVLFVSLFGAAQPLLAQAPQQAHLAAAAVFAPDPAEQVHAAARMLRTNDLAGLAKVLLPPAQLQVMRGAYEMKRNEPTTDADRAQFAEGIAKVMAPDAVEKLMAEIEPRLVEARPQAPGALMMGLGALQVAITSPQTELSADQRVALQSALPGIQRWASTTDFLSSKSVRQALTLITQAARNTGVSNLDQLKMLSFEEVLARAGNVLAASKKALGIYGLDLDAIAGSMQVQVLANDGQNARVRATFTVFDAPISSEHDLVLVDGRWYGKKALAHWQIHSEAQG